MPQQSTWSGFCSVSSAAPARRWATLVHDQTSGAHPRSTQLLLSSAAERTPILLAANRPDHARALSRAVRIVRRRDDEPALECQREIRLHGFAWAKSPFANSLWCHSLVGKNCRSLVSAK